MNNLVSHPATVGEWIAALRRQRGWTQQKLAEAVPCQRGYINRIEKNRQRPGEGLAERLADLLHVPAEQRLLFLHLARPMLATHPMQRIPISHPVVMPIDATHSAFVTPPAQHAWIICVPTSPLDNTATIFETIATLMRDQTPGDAWAIRAS